MPVSKERSTSTPRQSAHSRNPWPPKPAFSPSWETDQIDSPRLLLLSMTWEAVARNPDLVVSDYSEPVQKLYFDAVDFAVQFALAAAGVPDSWEGAFQKAMARHEGLCAVESGVSVVDFG